MCGLWCVVCGCMCGYLEGGYKGDVGGGEGGRTLIHSYIHTFNQSIRGTMYGLGCCILLRAELFSSSHDSARLTAISTAPPPGTSRGSRVMLRATPIASWCQKPRWPLLLAFCCSLCCDVTSQLCTRSCMHACMQQWKGREEGGKKKGGKKKGGRSMVDNKQQDQHQRPAVT